MNWSLQHTPVATYQPRACGGFTHRRKCHNASLADALGVSPQHGIFVSDRTNSNLHRCRYVPYPDYHAVESFMSSSMSVKEVTARWECTQGKVPILVIETKPVFELIKAKL